MSLVVHFICLCYISPKILFSICARVVNFNSKLLKKEHNSTSARTTTLFRESTYIESLAFIFKIFFDIENNASLETNVSIIGNSKMLQSSIVYLNELDFLWYRVQIIQYAKKSIHFLKCNG